jgi:hypothetical protein
VNEAKMIARREMKRAIKKAVKAHEAEIQQSVREVIDEDTIRTIVENYLIYNVAFRAEVHRVLLDVVTDVVNEKLR